MYGLAYAKIPYDSLMEMDLTALVVVLKAEIDKEYKEFDTKMRQLSWQTALIMNASGNLKRPVKPDKLYNPKETDKKAKKENKRNIEMDRDELKKTFGL
jgi:hypothetical protein